MFVNICLFCDYMAKQDILARQFQCSIGTVAYLENCRFDGSWVTFNRECSAIFRR